MWFDHASGKEKIKFMFNNELSVDEIEFKNFLFNGDLVRFQFVIKKIPKVYPKKWDAENFNAISLVFSFVNINKFEFHGRKANFFCSPTFFSVTGRSVIEFKSEDFYLYCDAEFISIDGVSPYIDERWD